MYQKEKKQLLANHSLYISFFFRIEMYSTLSSSLAGVITEPSTLTSVAECFLQALLWLLLTKVDEFTALDNPHQEEEDGNQVVKIGSPGLVLSSSIEAIDPSSWPSSTEEEEKTPWAARSSLHPLPLVQSQSGGKRKLASITGNNIKYLGDIGRQFSR